MSDTIETTHLIETVPPPVKDSPVVQATAEAVDREIKAAKALTPKALIWSRIGELTDDELALIAWGLNRRDYDPDLPRADREAMVAQALSWHRLGGTRAGVDGVFEALLGGTEYFEHRRRIRFRASRSKSGDRVLGPDPKRVFLVDMIVDHERAISLGLSREEIKEALARSWRSTEGCKYRVRMRGFFANRSKPGDLVRGGD